MYKKKQNKGNSIFYCVLYFYHFYSSLLGFPGLVHDLPERDHISSLCAYKDLEGMRIWTPERQITGNYSEGTITWL